MSRKSLAIVAHAQQEPAVIEEIVLDEPRADEAIVEIHAVGICHADLAILHGIIPSSFPRVLGHEGAGIVQEIGNDVEHVKPGDKVILSFNPCGECENCEEKLPGYCTLARPRNWTGTRTNGSCTLESGDGKPIYGNFFGQSSFSRLAIVNRNCIVKVPQATELELFAPLGCGIQTGAGVVNNTCNLQRGESLIVSGCGAVGMSAIMAAKARGAATIIAVDIKDSRLALARELGATHILNGAHEQLVEQVQMICPPPAGVKYAFDTSGVPKVIESMIEVIGLRGKVVIVGATPLDKKISIQPLPFLDMGKSLVGSVEGESYPPESIPYLIEQARQGNLPLQKIVKHYHYTDFASAFEDMRSGKTIKPVLIWDDVVTST